MFRNSQTLKSLAQTIIATSNMVHTTATKLDSILDHSLSALDDIAADAHDYTSMAKLDHMTERRQDYIKKYEESMDTMPPELKALCGLI